MSLKSYKKILMSLIIGGITPAAEGFSSNNKSDPYPVYTTLEPHEFLYTRTKNRLKGNMNPDETCPDEWLSLSLSPFGENADIGRDHIGDFAELGDILLDAPWNMLGLLFGKIPNGQMYPEILQQAFNVIFPNTVPGTLNDDVLVIGDNDGNLVDLFDRFGFFSIPLRYRKRGIRFDLTFRLLPACSVFENFILKIEGGVSDICQEVVAFNNQTPATPPITSTIIGSMVTKANVDKYLMNELPVIAKELNRNICDFHRTSIEDTRVSLIWRKGYLINEGRSLDWPRFLLIPFISAEGTFPTTKKNDARIAFALPFGNNNHYAAGIRAGLNIDFTETIEIGAEAGATFFFSRTITDIPMPTSKYQSGIYPFYTDAKVRPGFNSHLGIKMNAYHFLDKLSFYFQYVIVNHSHDDITLVTEDAAFLPDVLQKKTEWRSQVGNIGFNYDISPNISLGFLWQAPLAERNAYRTSTLMFSFNAIF